MIKKTWSKLALAFLSITLIISLLIILYFISPEEIVRKIGINNTYLFVFFVSFFAGFSTWTSFSLIAVLVTFNVGGSNLVYLALISGIGLALGDIIMFFVSSKGRELIRGKWEKRLEKLSRAFKGKAKKFIPIITYIYMGLTPFPNDILIIFLAMVKYPIKKLYVPIILGDFTYPFIVLLLAAKGIMLLG